METPKRLTTLGEDRVLKPYPLSTVAIVGMGASAIDWLRFCYGNPEIVTREDFQTWTVNAGAMVFKSDLAFNMHTQEVFAEQNPKWLEVLKRDKTPVVMPCAYAEFPGSMEYPLHEVVTTFNDNYLMNTVAYAIAFAILCEVKRIYLFGCDYNYQGSSAYEHGRANVEYWCGQAKARGIQVDIGQSTSLMDGIIRRTSGLYGYGPRQPQFDTNGSEFTAVVGFAGEKEEPKLAIVGDSH